MFVLEGKKEIRDLPISIGLPDSDYFMMEEDGIRLDKKPEFNSKVGFMDSQDVYNLYKAGNLNLDYFNS